MLRILAQKDGKRVWHTATLSALRWVRQLANESADTDSPWEILNIEMLCPKCGMLGPVMHDAVCQHCWHIPNRKEPAIIYWSNE